MLLGLLGLGAGLLLPQLASGVINTGDSIEWLCECMPHIAIADPDRLVCTPSATGWTTAPAERSAGAVSGFEAPRATSGAA